MEEAYVVTTDGTKIVLKDFYSICPPTIKKQPRRLFNLGGGISGMTTNERNRETTHEPEDTLYIDSDRPNNPLHLKEVVIPNYRTLYVAAGTIIDEPICIPPTMTYMQIPASMQISIIEAAIGNPNITLELRHDKD